MRKLQRSAKPKQTARPVSNTVSSLPYGLGSLSFRSASYWMIYRNSEGVRIQESANTKNITVARVMLAERVLERVVAQAELLQGVIREGTTALSTESIYRLTDGTWVGDGDGDTDLSWLPEGGAGIDRRAARDSRRAEASARTRKAVKA